MEIWLYFLVCFGITSIIVYSSVFKPIREWLKFELLMCPMCTGFWVALGLSSTAVDGGDGSGKIGDMIAMLLISAASSGVTWFLASIAVSGYAAKEYFNISAKQRLREELTISLMEKKLKHKKGVDDK